MLETSDFKFGSRNYSRSLGVSRNKASSNSSCLLNKLDVGRLEPSGIIAVMPSIHENEELPSAVREQIEKFTKAKMNFSIKVRERDYEIHASTSEGIGGAIAQRELTLDDMSCGSSLASDTDTDEEFFNKAKFKRIREMKVLSHKKAKLASRSMEVQKIKRLQFSVDVPNMPNFPTIPENTVAFDQMKPCTDDEPTTSIGVQNSLKAESKRSGKTTKAKPM